MTTLEEKPDNVNRSRRDFVKTGALLASGALSGFAAPVETNPAEPTAKPTLPPTVVGANERLTVGFIGVGSNGRHSLVANHVKFGSEQNVAGAAVCDVWSKRCDEARADLGLGEADAYTDYRHILDRGDIDAVFVSTIDHWHARIAIDAMEAGKHVYGEKPLTRYIGESFEVADTVERTGIVFQLGSQYTTEAKWHKAAELVRSGRIGALVLGQSSYVRNIPEGEWNYEIDPDLTEQTCDWKQWLGPVSDRPFNAEQYFRWKKYHSFSAGIISNLLTHRIAPLLIATGAPEFPNRVACLGSRKVTPDREIPDQTEIIVEFPSGFHLILLGSTVNEQGLEQIVRGHEATLYMGPNGFEIRPERPFADLVDPERFDDLRPDASVHEHMANFYEAVRTGIKPNGNIDLALKTQTVVSLAEMSNRLGEMLHFDAETRTITTGNGSKVAPITYGTLEES